MTLHLIEEWRYAWRYFSVWYAGVAFALLATWNMMPYQLRRVVPDWLELLVSAILFLGYVYVRFVAQPKTKAKIAQKMAEKQNAPA